jgi:hypothetical protein
LEVFDGDVNAGGAYAAKALGGLTLKFAQIRYFFSPKPLTGIVNPYAEVYYCLFGCEENS